MRHAYGYIRESCSAVLNRVKARPASLFLTFLLSAVFLFVCNLTVASSTNQAAVELTKKYGVMFGLVLAMAYLFPAFARGRFFTEIPAHKIALYFIFIAGLFVACLWGPPHLFSFGNYFAHLATDYWSTDYTGDFAVMLKRAALPALSHLFGFQEDSYVYFWFMIYLIGLWLAIRLLIEKGLTFLECLSLLTSSLFAYELVLPGYVEVLVLALAFYCTQRSTGLIEKAVILTLAMATHEVAACFFFFSVMVASSREDREEWFLIFPSVVVIDVVVAYVSQTMQHGERPGESLTVEGLYPYQWMQGSPIITALGVFIAYKLYWLVVIWACFQRRYWLPAATVLLLLPIMFMGTDTSRLIQFGSLSLFMLVPQVISTWPMWIRLVLAVVNLAIPSLYLACNSVPLWGWGYCHRYLDLLYWLGFHDCG